MIAIPGAEWKWFESEADAICSLVGLQLLRERIREVC